MIRISMVMIVKNGSLACVEGVSSQDKIKRFAEVGRAWLLI